MSEKTMEELGKFVASLPLPAAIAFVSVFGAVVAVSWRGILKGKELDPARETHAATVAAVVVDPTALNALTAAVTKHTAVLEDMLDAGKDLAKTFDHMAIELDRVREEMRIQREVSRRV
jgi:hypothetical protein